MKSATKPRRAAKARGASSKSTEVARFQWQKLLPFCFALIGSAMLVVVYQASLIFLNKPVARVLASGEFRYVDKQVVINEVQPFLAEGFIRLDLEGIRNQLLIQPWVFDVKVTRVWPDQIDIKVIEQTAIAKWGDNGFLNHRGEIFFPTKRKNGYTDFNDLPRLHGPESRALDVVSYFRQLSEALKRHDLALNALTLNKRGGWAAQINNEVSVVLGDGEIMEKMKRFIDVYSETLTDHFDRVASIDMRYSNGFALAWRQPVVN